MGPGCALYADLNEMIDEHCTTQDLELIHPESLTMPGWLMYHPEFVNKINGKGKAVCKRHATSFQ